MKYRIKHEKFSNNKESYTVQERFLFIFWKTKIVDMGMYGAIQTYDTLEEAILALDNIINRGRTIKVLETNYIWRDK